MKQKTRMALLVVSDQFSCTHGEIGRFHVSSADSTRISNVYLRRDTNIIDKSTTLSRRVCQNFIFPIQISCLFNSLRWSKYPYLWKQRITLACFKHIQSWEKPWDWLVLWSMLSIVTKIVHSGQGTLRMSQLRVTSLLEIHVMSSQTSKEHSRMTATIQLTKWF